MSYIPKKQVFNAGINEVEIGTGGRAVRLGGNHTLPFFSFDAPAKNAPLIGAEISDLAPETYTQAGLRAFYEGCDTVEAMAVKAQEMEGVSFIALGFDSADPNGNDTSVEDCAALAVRVADAVSLPLVVSGCGNLEKDAELLKKLSEVLSGRNVLILAAKEENYKEVGPAALDAGHKIGAESSVDINLAKQLSTILTQAGVPSEQIVMQAGCAAAGYGFEYVASTLDRIKAAALSSGDAMLQMPIITPVSAETWGVKESQMPESEMPEWGDAEERGIRMEIVTASACLTSGSDAVIMRHPQAIRTVAEMIRGLA